MSQPRVAVVAGRSLSAVATALARRGLLVALVSDIAVRNDGVAVHFRTDPADRDTWERIAMHVEQHLGPIDVVVSDVASAAVVEEAFGADLARRHRPAVLTADDADQVVSRVLGTP